MPGPVGRLDLRRLERVEVAQQALFDLVVPNVSGVEAPCAYEDEAASVPVRPRRAVQGDEVLIRSCVEPCERPGASELLPEPPQVLGGEG